MTTVTVLFLLLITVFIAWIITVARNFDLKYGNERMLRMVRELQREVDAYKFELAKHNDKSLLANASILNKKE